MHPELEKLIELALANGDLSEKSRAVILRKAETLGEDKDEVELVIDGKLAQIQKVEKDTAAARTPHAKFNKEGNVRKCPACGATVPSFTAQCTDCGHEFRNVESTGSVQSVHEALLKAEENARSSGGGWGILALVDKETALEKKSMNAKSTVISTFPVPNTKEDVLEFLALAASQVSSISIGLLVKLAGANGTYGYRINYKNAWLAKCQQVISKGRLLFKDDQKFLAIVENYAKDLKIK